MKSMVSSARIPLVLPLRESPRSSIIPRHIRRSLRSILEHHPFNFLRTYYEGLGSCLLYHCVNPRKFYPEEISPYSGLAVCKECFEEQIRYFKEHFNCLSLSQAVKFLSEGTLPRRSMVITFDDGYKDNREVALPILEKYQVPATVYVSTGLLDRSAELWWFEQEFIVKNCTQLDFKWESKTYRWSLKSYEEKYAAILGLNRFFRWLPPAQQRSFMQVLREQCPHTYSYDSEILTWDELIEFDRHPLITIGAHTKNHPMLSRLDQAELLIELQESKQYLEQRLGHPVPHLAYPFGGMFEAGRREFDAAVMAGYASAVTTRYGHLYKKHKQYLHLLPRISINYDDSLDTVVWKLNGMYSMLLLRGKRLMVG